MRILVCGGRDFADIEAVRTALWLLPSKVELCHGGARGADSLAEKVAREFGWAVTVFPADWRKHGKAAGPIRNQQMLDTFRPELVIAFPGGKGTADMVSRALLAGVKVRQVPPPSPTRPTP